MWRLCFEARSRAPTELGDLEKHLFNYHRCRVLAVERIASGGMLHHASLHVQGLGMPSQTIAAKMIFQMLPPIPRPSRNGSLRKS